MRQNALSRLFTGWLVMALVAAASVAVIAATPTPASAQAVDLGFGGGTGRPGAPAPVDMPAVSSTPQRNHWGVTGLDPNRTVNFDTPVWDFAVIGERIYVGGAFLNVQRNGTSAPIARPYLAAFDLRSGAWDPNFQPQLNGSVWALEVSPRGTLLVGGEFTSVEGRPNTQGLTSLDPVTGAFDTQWTGQVDRPWTPDRAVVRSLEVIGNNLYVAGNFSHAEGGSNKRRVRAGKVARFDARSGNPDGTFNPAVGGAGVWGFGIDTARNRMHLTGFFSSVGGAAGTANFATVDLETGSLVTGLQPLPRNNSRQFDMYDVEVAGDRIWAGGSEHIVHVLDAGSRQQIGWHTTGYRSPDNFSWDRRDFFIGGGDYQVVEEVGNFILAGCHCNREERNGILSHYSSFDNARFRTLMLEAYNTATGRLVPSFVPDLAQSIEGAWAVHSDGLGCLLVGGDFELGGLETGSAFWLGNWARFCPPGVDIGPDTTSPSIPTGVTAVSPGNGGDDSVTVSWTASTDNRAVASYDIYRDGVVIGNTTGTTFTDGSLPAGASFAYRVQAIDTSGNRSAGSPPVTVTVAGADVSPPSIPVGLAATVDGSNVTLTWNASTDNRGVTGYAVFRNGAYIGWANGTTYTNTGVPIGTFDYALRAYDAAGNRSDRSAPLSVTVGGADTEPPTVPTGLAGTVDGSTVTLTWNASTDNRGVTGYAVYRTGAYIGWANGTTFTNTGVPDGTQNYTVRAFDAANNRSALTPALSVTVGSPDTEAPSVPTGLAADVNGSTVILTWTPSMDNRGVTGYGVFRNGAYIGWATGTTFANMNVPAGTYNYTLRAYDAAGNRSDRSDPLSVTVG